MEMTHEDRIREAMEDARRFIAKAERVLEFDAQSSRWKDREPPKGSEYWRFEDWYRSEPERKEARNDAMERARLDLSRSLGRMIHNMQ
jgi:hypothetical protein